jgi:hypothetical protein
MNSPESVAAALERGEVYFLGAAPFALPAENDSAFLSDLTPAGRRKHISYNPHTNTVSGLARCGDGQSARLAEVLDGFSRAVCLWLGDAFPCYAGGLEMDRATLRPLEEATRLVRRNARNDLLHIDAFPNRPARGSRILRVFANLHPSEDRVWAISEPLPRLMDRFGKRVERSTVGWWHDWSARLLRPFRPEHRRHLGTDLFMLRMHDYLKRNTDFQLGSPRKLWKFPPGSAWLAMTDGCCHAELRGSCALEHSFFVAPDVLLCPDLAPAHLVSAGAAA